MLHILVVSLLAVAVVCSSAQEQHTKADLLICGARFLSTDSFKQLTNLLVPDTYTSPLDTSILAMLFEGKQECYDKLNAYLRQSDNRKIEDATIVIGTDAANDYFGSALAAASTASLRKSDSTSTDESFAIDSEDSSDLKTPPFLSETQPRMWFPTVAEETVGDLKLKEEASDSGWRTDSEWTTASMRATTAWRESSVPRPVLSDASRAVSHSDSEHSSVVQLLQWLQSDSSKD